MGTTTKMAIPYPEATGLVKDGWEDMKDIATQVDAKSGLVLLNSTSFSAVSSQSINDVFSTNYNNYRFILDFTASAGIGIDFRFRVGGVDDSSSSYQRQVIYNTSGTTVGAVRTNNTNSLRLVNITSSSNRSSIIVDFTSNPFATILKGFTAQASEDYNSAAETIGFSGFGFNNTTSFTGFSLLPTSGTITGSINVYGYNK